jgi:hypothetical protein
VKLLDEGLLGAMGLVSMVVAVGFVSPVVEQNPDKFVHHSFPVKGMLRRGFLGLKTAPSLASSSASASSGTFEVLATPTMVSVGPTESEDGHLDLDPDPDPKKCVVGAFPLDFCTIDTTSIELTDTQLGLIEHQREELMVNDTTKVVLKHSEEIFLWVIKSLRDGVLSTKGESILAFHFKQIEKLVPKKMDPKKPLLLSFTQS